MKQPLIILLSYFILSCGRTEGLAPGDAVNAPTTTPTPITPTPFSPTQITNLHSWYDGADSSTMSLSGSAVTAWRDKQTSSAQFSQNSASLQPSLNSNAMNGKSALQFDGVNDVMSAIVATNIGADVTVSYVVQLTNFNSTIPFSFSTNSYANGPDVYFSSAKLSWNIGDGVANPFTNSAYPTINTPHIITVKNSSILNKADLYLDRAYIGTANYRSTVATNLASPRLYVGNWTNGSYYINGYFGELVIYNKVLDEAERADLELYLKNKWGAP